jgi:hypothetical protein
MTPPTRTTPRPSFFPGTDAVDTPDRRRAGAWRSPAKCWRVVVALGLLFATEANAVLRNDSIRGLPFSRTYSLEDIGYVPRGSRVNFDIFGRVAVIHEGVYAVLNDTVWSNLSEPNDPTHYPINDVVHTAHGSFYGGRASWGLAEFGPDGKLHARSLVPPNAPAWTRTSTFDSVIATTEGVYFVSRGGMAFWDFATQQSHLLEVPQMTTAFAVGDKVYASSFDQPLRFIDVRAHTVHPVSGTQLDQQVVAHSAKLDETRTLVSYLNGAPLVFDGTDVTPWRAEVDLSGKISALERLADGNIAIAITGKGVFVLSPAGSLLLSLTIPQYQRVSSIASRERGVLWLLTEDSVEKVLYEGGLTSFGQRLGLPLMWPSVATWNGRLFVASGLDLYEAIATDPRATATFQPVKIQPPAAGPGC